MLKKNVNFIVNAVYGLVIIAIAATLILSLKVEENFYLQKKVVVQNPELTKVLLQLSLDSDKISIKTKSGFDILNIQLNNNLGENFIIDDYKKLIDEIISLAKKIYENDYQVKKEFLKIYDQNSENIELNTLQQVERIIEIRNYKSLIENELSIFENRLISMPEVVKVEKKYKILPVVIFLIIILLIFHFNKKKLIKFL